MSKKIVVFSIVAISLGLAMGVNADVKRYAGSECVVVGTNQAYAYYWSGMVDNTSSSRKQFYCPIVLDVDKVSGVGLTVWDRNYSQDFTCQLRNPNPLASNGSYYYKNISVDGGSYSSPRKKYVSGGLSYYTDGYRYLSCWVPGVYNGSRSRIVSYWINEG